MAAHPPSAHLPHPASNWPSTLASLTVGALFFALWFWLLPQWLDFEVDLAHAAPWRWIAIVPAVIGFAIALRCIWDFGWTGHGTPAPFAPPRRLVVVGFYRYVRNPMYLGFFLGWAGLWVVFGHVSVVALAVTLIGVSAVLLFVTLYEEPHLRRVFGPNYEEYCRHVHRWVPRLHPWSN